MRSTEIETVLDSFLSEQQARVQKLISAFEAAWRDTQILLAAQADLFRTHPGKTEPGVELTAIERLMESSARPLLFDLVAGLRRVKPQERALSGLEDYETASEDLLSRLPVEVEVPQAVWLNVLTPLAGSPVMAMAARLRHHPEVLPLRELLGCFFQQESNLRARLDGAVFVVLAKAVLLLLEPWQQVRREALGVLAGHNGGSFEEARLRWMDALLALHHQGEDALQNQAAWAAASSERAARFLLRHNAPFSPQQHQDLLDNRQNLFRYWARQRRSVNAAVDVEYELGQAALEGVSCGRAILLQLDQEQAGLLQELESVITWLQTFGMDDAGDFPAPQNNLVSGEDHASDWQRRMEAFAESRLPQVCDALQPHKPLPPRAGAWRQLHPRNVLLSALDGIGHARVLEGCREAEAVHRSVVREIERTREVVEFGLETAQEEGQGAIAQESVSNALALAIHQRERTQSPRALVEQRLVEGLAGTLFLTHFTLEQRRLGLLTQLIRNRGSEAFQTARELGFHGTSEGGRRLYLAVGSAYRAALIKIGWEPPPVEALEQVTLRGYVDEVLNLRSDVYDLPMIYRRLFRLAPLQDPRFLVGRETEMSALAAARGLWDAGRGVAVLLVGARGSGKTSMLNCAVAGRFADVPVVQSYFSRRLTTAHDIHLFLCDLLQLPEGSDFLQELRSTRRVVILEELERTFLRRLGGFQAIQELLRIISSTSRTTLWVLSMNQHSFRFLDAAVGLGENFSHRINAMAVTPEELKSAILMRHHLSGLRLQYPPPLKMDPQMGRLRALLGLQQDPETRFFDALYRQSEGIFRSAFELWQKFMDRVEGGVLYLRQPEEPDYEPLLASLTLRDSQALHAIVQHGSLTAEDHAGIFECTVADSRLRLEKLIALEFLESDPLCPGLRIRPEAGRIVHMALHRMNLI
ncbi:ATP-binding protein [Paludibaculum fermentans]|uniref:ATP-binding protein n=1 Tax=Paludibaculum fermentans TaxID=1473598 RepID=UPI003EC02998